MSKRTVVDKMLAARGRVAENLERKKMIQAAVDNHEALVAANGALATWTPPESTGRSPKDTLIVKRAISEAKIDWDSPNNIPVSEETFEMLFADAVDALRGKDTLYVTDRVLGADSAYALSVRTVTDQALTALFTDNMFRPLPDDLERSVFADKGFTLLALPYDKLDRERYQGRLRNLADGKASDMAVAIDLDQRVGVVYGSAYGGSVKKLMFSVMNYMLPEVGILPLHCSANEGPNGHVALLLGLSGTGKTTLSADPERALLGDDEHGWADDGVFNFEGGCYAKTINLSEELEPLIWNATRHFGTVLENVSIDPYSRRVDFNESSLTENTRAAYPVGFLENSALTGRGGHPSNIFFLSADAFGVMPPIARLTPEQAMYYFLSGYTSKLAGTEKGVTEPQATFSACFGAPFLPLHPSVYANLLGEKIDQHKTKIWLINTGWTGGPYGEGSRINLPYTRAMIRAALSGELDEVEMRRDPNFCVDVPEEVPGVPTDMLNPRLTWDDLEKYDIKARVLTTLFQENFAQFAGQVSQKIAFA